MCMGKDSLLNVQYAETPKLQRVEDQATEENGDPEDWSSVDEDPWRLQRSKLAVAAWGSRCFGRGPRYACC